MSIRQIHKYSLHRDSTLGIYFANQAANDTKTLCSSSFKAELCPLVYPPEVWFGYRLLLLIRVLVKPESDHLSFLGAVFECEVLLLRTSSELDFY